jgi:uncharacterized membrane protein YphA (DoxX/SURF4 family)
MTLDLIETGRDYLWNCRTRIRRWVHAHSNRILRLSVCLIFVWFGALKLFPGMSPAEGLAGNTIQIMTLGVVSPEVSVPVLGVLEIMIGMGMLYRPVLRLTAVVLLLHMVGAAAPILLLPDKVFVRIPFVLTLEGQYILKNIVIITATLVIGATIRTKTPLPIDSQSANFSD